MSLLLLFQESIAIPPTSLFPSSIGSGEVFPAVSPTINRNLTAGSILSAYVTGAFTIQRGAVSRPVASLASAEAFGTNKINRNLSSIAINTAYISGNLQINRNINTVGNIATGYTSGSIIVNRGAVSITTNSIAGGYASGTATVSSLTRLFPTAISTSYLSGTPQVNRNVKPTSISTGYASGAFTLSRSLSISGITSSEIFGTLKVNRNLNTTGVVTGYTSGTQKVNRNLSTVGITSGQNFGTAKLNRNINFGVTPRDRNELPQSTLVSIFGDGNGTGTYERQAQELQPTSTYFVKKIMIYLREVGTISDFVFLEIRQGTLTGTVIGTSDSKVSSDIPSTVGQVEFNFLSGVQLSQGITYYIITLRSGSDVNNFVDSYLSVSPSMTHSIWYRNAGIWNEQYTEYKQIFTIFSTETSIPTANVFGIHTVAQVSNVYLTGVTTAQEFGILSLNTYKNLLPASINTSYASGTVKTQRALSLVSTISRENVATKRAVPTVTTNTSTSIATNVSSHTWSHTVPSGSNKLLLVQVGRRASVNRVASVTFNGVPLTLIARGISGQTAGYTNVWYLINPPEITANIVVTNTISIENNSGIGINLTGVDQTNPFGNTINNLDVAVTTLASLNIASSTEELVIDFAMTYITGANTLGALGSGQTLIANIQPSGNHQVATSYKTGSTSTNMTSGVSTVNSYHTNYTAVAVQGIGSSSVKINRNLTPTAISTTEIFGVLTVNRGLVNIVTTSIASLETFGTLMVNRGAVSRQITGIASAEAFGTTKINRNLTFVGITSGQSFGTLKLNNRVKLAISLFDSNEDALVTGFSIVGNVGGGGRQRVAQEFISSATYYAKKISLLLGKSNALFGSAVLELRAGTVDGSLVGTSDSVPISAISVLPTWIDFKISTTLLIQGTTYFLVVRRLTDSPDGTLIVYASDAGLYGAVYGMYASVWDETSALENLNFIIWDSEGSIYSKEAFGTLKINKSVTFVGITSAQAFGTLTVNRGSVNIVPTSVASAETVNSIIVNRGAISRSVTGIASAEAFGALTVNRGAISRPVTGIVSAEAYGIVKLNKNLTAVGIITAQIFGTLKVNRNVTTASTTTAETFGILKLNRNVKPAALALAETFGTVNLTRGAISRNITSITSAESVNNVTVNRGTTSRQITSIASAYASGTLILNRNLTTVAIASLQAFGTLKLNRNIKPNSITSNESVNNVSISKLYRFYPVSITTLESVNNVTLSRGAVSVLAVSIASAQAFGTLTLNRGAVSRSVTSIGTEEAFGTPVISTGAGGVYLTGITSTQQFGTLTINKGSVSVSLTSIASAQSVSSVTVNRGAASIVPTAIITGYASGTLKINRNVSLTAISSAQTFGTLKLNRNLAFSGIASAQEFGTPTAQRINTINLLGVATQQAFGTLTVNRGSRTLTVTSITSTQAFGSLQVNRGARSITVTGISSAQVFGTPVLNVSGVNISLTGILSAYTTGSLIVTRGAFYISAVSITSAGVINNVIVNRGSRTLTLSGITTAQTFGTLKLNRNVRTTGTATANVVNNVIVNRGARTISLTGLVSQAAVSPVIISTGALYAFTNSITTSETVNNVTVNRGVRSINLSGIATQNTFGTFTSKYRTYLNSSASAETFGATSLNKRNTIQTGFITTGEYVSNINVNSRINIRPVSITSGVAVGFILIAVQAIYIQPTGLATLESFGLSSVQRGLASVYISSISSIEQIGLPAVSAGFVELFVNTINSEETFGVVVSNLQGQIQLSSIISAESVSNIRVKQTTTLIPVSITSLALVNNVRLIAYIGTMPRNKKTLGLIFSNTGTLGITSINTGSIAINRSNIRRTGLGTNKKTIRIKT